LREKRANNSWVRVKRQNISYMKERERYNFCLREIGRNDIWMIERERITAV
jgi:hypothetical protein